MKRATKDCQDCPLAQKTRQIMKKLTKITELFKRATARKSKELRIKHKQMWSNIIFNDANSQTIFVQYNSWATKPLYTNNRDQSLNCKLFIAPFDFI